MCVPVLCARSVCECVCSVEADLSLFVKTFFTGVSLHPVIECLSRNSRHGHADDKRFLII